MIDEWQFSFNPNQPLLVKGKVFHPMQFMFVLIVTVIKEIEEEEVNLKDGRSKVLWLVSNRVFHKNTFSKEKVVHTLTTPYRAYINHTQNISFLGQV